MPQYGAETKFGNNEISHCSQNFSIFYMQQILLLVKRISKVLSVKKHFCVNLLFYSKRPKLGPQAKNVLKEAKISQSGYGRI
jgi:uncharacterized protein (UPF0332 family)